MKKLVSISFLAILLASIGAATTISQETVTVDLEDNTVNSVLEVEDLTTETFNYQTTHPIRNLNVEINSQEADCQVQELAVGATVNCDTVLTENFTVDLTYRTEDLVNQQEDINIFRYSQSIYRPIDNYNFKVILPEGSGVVDPDDATTSVIVPENGEVGNMDGRRFFVEWNTNPELGQPQSFRVLFEPFEEPPTNNRIIPGSIFALLVILGTAYFVYRRKNQVEASSILDELGEDEQLVVEMLRESDGEKLQKDIVNESDYSKAKISGVVSTLVDEGIVSKEKEGRSNKVSLDDKFRN